MDSDFGNDGNLPIVSPDKGQKRKAGEERAYLKVFETLPAQLLNVYGPSAYVDKPDAEVWKQLNTKLKSGAKYMTELCSKEAERRGVGINRFLACVLEFIKYQEKESTKKQNSFLLKEETYKQLYAEIGRMKGALEYVLAPQKSKQSSGAASLRAGSSRSHLAGMTEVRETELLKEEAGKVFTWLDKNKRSWIRMVMMWQGSSGVSFVGATHHRATQCWRYHGNQCHNESQGEVSVSEFQDAVVARHNCSAGSITVNSENAADFG